VFLLKLICAMLGLQLKHENLKLSGTGYTGTGYTGTGYTGTGYTGTEYTGTGFIGTGFSGIVLLNFERGQFPQHFISSFCQMYQSTTTGMINKILMIQKLLYTRHLATLSCLSIGW